MSVIIHGTVADLAGRPAAGQRVAVLAWAPNAAISVMLVQGFADREGRFRLEYAEPAEPADDAYVTACALGADGRVLGWTENLAGAPEDALVRIALGAANPIPLSAGRPDDTELDLPTSGTLAPPPAPDGEEYAVSGRISWPDGTAAIGVVVRAVDKDLRSEEALGPYAPDFDHETRTDGDGRYRIPYLSRQFSRHEIASADLVVRVLARDGRIAAASSVLFNAPRDATVDLELPARAPRLPAEFERVIAALERLLDRGQDDRRQDDRADRDPAVTASAITAADIPFLAGETGIPVDRFQAVIAASALIVQPDGVPPDPSEVEVEVEAEQWVPAASGVFAAVVDLQHPAAATVPIEVLYGLIRVGDPADWPAMAAISADRLTEDIDRAVDEGIISDRMRTVAQRHADAIAAVAGQALSAWVEQVAGLADPALRYARTGTVVNPVVDARLDLALRDAVRQAIGTASADLAVAAAPALDGLSWRAVRPQSTIAARAVNVLNWAVKLDPAVVPAARAALAQLDQQPATTVGAALSLDVPVRDNPWLADDLCTATMSVLAGIAGLSGAARDAVVAAASALASTPEETLAELAAEQELSPDQAAAVRVMLELSDLTDGNIPLIGVLSEQGATSLPELAGWSAEQWRRLLRGKADEGEGEGDSVAAIPLPPGLGVEQYADLLVAGLELACPTQALAARLDGEDDAVRAFFADNPDVDLRAVDLARGDVDSLDWQHVPTGDRPRVEAELRSYQRLLALADTTADRVALSRSGFDCAFAIVELSEAEFSARSGLDGAVARLTYARAQDLAANAAHAFSAVLDVIQPPWPGMPVANQSPDLLGEVIKVRGLAELLEPRPSGGCADCDSVLGPTACFVDLMHFAERQISGPTFVAPKLTDHPRYLKNRRPDLWTLPLTCDSAGTLIPALRIVNEVLETRLAALLGRDPYQALADPADQAACTVPFSLPHAELGLYLGHFGLTPAYIYRTLRLPDATVNRAQTGLDVTEQAAAGPLSLDQLQFVLTGTPSLAAPYVGDLQSVSALVEPSARAGLVDALAAMLDVSSGRLSDMISWTGLEIIDDLPDDPQSLLDLVRRLERVALLFDRLRFSDETVGYLTADVGAGAGKLGVTDRADLTYTDIGSLSAYAAFCARTSVPEAETHTRALLDAYAATDSFGPDQRSHLALLTGATTSLVDSVLDAFALPAVPLAALSQADEIIACCTTLGIDAHALLKLGQDGNYADLAAAARVAADAVAAQFADEATRDRVLSAFEDEINALKRDALCGHLIGDGGGGAEPHFGSRKDLSDYFLVDVEAEGCARTTRVDAAISSVQLYVQRCRMGLEQADPALVPQEQWAWRRSFRVWRAGREAFLHPESHLDADLRDDRTALLSSLADAAPEQQVAEYRAESERLAGLEIIEVCYDAASGVHHVLGRTRQDPPTTYHRSWDGVTWQPWTPAGAQGAQTTPPGIPETVVRIGGEQFVVRENKTPLLLGGLPARSMADAVQAERQFSSATHILDEPNEAAQPDAAPSAFAKSSTPILFTPLAIAARNSLIRLSGSGSGPDQPADAFDVYHRELLLHLPLLIAERLNAAGRHEDALHWFQQVLDPTTTESRSLEQLVTDPAALAAYQKAPFNPFAVARLRPAALQKAIVLQFVSNLTSWVDDLPVQDDAQAANEATLLCALASDILGPRPADHTARTSPAAPESEHTYETIASVLDDAPKLLATLENWVYQTRWSALGYPAAASVVPFDTVTALADARARQYAFWASAPVEPAYPPHLIVQAALAFRVPPNPALLACWDALEDRLARLRRRAPGAATR
ncbi:MAG TPA: neuraminidase-like domain-containing protein [Actinocrinis sp.]|jgi:hypothetical protein